MRFFEHQEKARNHTFRLLVLFGLGVFALIFSIDGILLLGLGYSDSPGGLDSANWGKILATYFPALALVAAFIGFVIGSASLYRLSQLSSGGGASVAESLGGRLLQPETRNPVEQKILNIVEEMAIASGMPVPRVYLMDEDGINAFAAGWSPNDAVIGVTRGCVKALSRDELQGVIAHEFSHILNGDMKLNIRLMGILYGIFFLSILGEILIRSISYSSNDKKNDGKGAILMIGFVLFILGWVGWFFGRLIQAAVSRQREFLADASAVQFTRNPEGIGGALRKIAGWNQGSIIRNPHATEASHLFFGNGISGFSALFATHPPLEERIHRIEGIYFQPPENAPETTSTEPTEDISFSAAQLSNLAGTMRMPAKNAAPPVPILIPIENQCKDPAGALAVLYSMLLPSDNPARINARDQLINKLDPAIAQALFEVEPLVLQINKLQLFTLLSKALPSLKMLGKEQSIDAIKICQALISADGKIDFFEFCLWRLAKTGLEKFRQVKGPGAALGIAASTVFSFFAKLSDAPAPAYQKAIQAAGIHGLLANIETKTDDFKMLDKVFDFLAQANSEIKHKVLDGCIAAILHDGKITQDEGVLLRAFCLSMEIPLPPLG
ncbi:MAG: M48 family metallopeptidase [Planctomycetota bacterium]|nr:M48 family metallopeptidase [Planctomycetota bacterium]